MARLIAGRGRKGVAVLRFRVNLLGRTSLASLVGASLLLTTTSSLSAHPVAKALPSLRLDYYVDGHTLAVSLDPALVGVGGFADAETVAMVQANLVHILPNGRVAPDLATWRISKNRLVYTFTIRKNARFSNGHHVTAQDAAFSLKRALAPSTKSPVAPTYLGLIRGAQAYNSGTAQDLSGVKVLGQLTLQIRISQPAGYFLDTLSYPSGDVLDPAVVKGKPAIAAHNFLTTTCAGNQGAGPFKFVCHDRSSTVRSFYSGRTPMYTLVPNPYYYGRHPHVGIQLPSNGHGYRQYLADRVDASFLPPVYLSRWRGRSSELRQFPSSGVSFLTLNTNMVPFNNVHCRRAIAYAIDRKAIANVTHGTQRPTYAVVPRGMLGYYPGNDNPRYSVKRARADLSQCPSRTAPFGLKFENDLPGIVNAFTLIGTELRAIGMNVTLMPLTFQDYLAAVSQRLDKTGTQIIEDGWSQDYPDPQDYLFIRLHSGSAFNTGGWHNARYDQLVDQADALSKRSTRAKLYIRAQHIALKQGSIVVLSNAITYELVKPYVHGLVGTEAYSTVMPKDDDWANVSLAKH